MSTTTNAPVNDWSLASRGAASTTAVASLAAAAIAAVGGVAHIPCVIGGAIGVLGALCHLVVGARRHYDGAAVAYRLAVWVGAGSWLTYTMWGDHVVWSKPSLISLAIGAGVAGGLGLEFGKPNRDPDKSSGALVLWSTARASNEWEDRFRRVCKATVRVPNIRQWDNGFGYDVYVEIPANAGMTLKQIEGRADALATDADLPEGCGIEFQRNGSRAKFIARVSTANRLEASIPFPEDFSQSSIYDDKSLGECRNGDPALINLREDSAVVAGQKRSGKTNTLDVITARVGLCYDALPVHIDLNGGGISQLWLRPWLEGKTERPAIPWAAGDPLEALYLSEVMLRIAKHRKTAYAAFKAESNNKLLQLSESLPELVAIVDEGAESMGLGANNDPILQKLKSNLEELQRIAGDAGINVLPSALRATQDVISTAVLAQCAIRVGMRMQDKAELAYLFGWQHQDAIDPADLPAGNDGKGSGFYSTGTAAPRPFKAYFMDPKQIKRAAIAIANTRPELDEESRQIADARFEIDLKNGRPPLVVENLYSTRYERMRKAFASGGQAEQEEPEDAIPAYSPPAPQRQPAAAPAWSAPSVGVDLSDPANWPDLTASAPPAPARQTAGVLTAAPVQTVPQILVQALAAFDAAGVERMHSETLAAALGVESVVELPKLLGAIDVRPLAQAFIVNGGRARGYARQTLADAAEKVARGEIDVPDAVAEWPAA